MEERPVMTTARSCGAESGLCELLPPHLIERYEYVKQYHELTLLPKQSDLASCVGKMRALGAHIRHCNNIVEGSVAALGVSSAYDVISRLNEVHASQERVHEAWRETSLAAAEMTRVQGQLFDEMCSGYSALKDKCRAVEKELRQVLSERDRQNATVDSAIQYVHDLIAEHAAWQEQHGHNAMQLPLTEDSYGEKCRRALHALYALRPSPSSPALPTLPIARPFVSLVDNTTTSSKSVNSSAGAAAARLERSVSTRHSCLTPSTRLRYVPPAAEVALLRSVLAMGTASTTLMKDIQDERSRLEAMMARVRIEAERTVVAFHAAKKELLVFKQYLYELIAGGLPFIAHKNELVMTLLERVRRVACETPGPRRSLGADSAAAVTNTSFISGDETPRGAAPIAGFTFPAAGGTETAVSESTMPSSKSLV